MTGIRQPGAPAGPLRRARERDEILDAAARVFRARGYGAATVEDVAAELGMLKGSLYHYIRSKQDLLFEVVESAFTEAVESIETAVAIEAPARARIEAAIVQHMEVVDAQFPRLWVALVERSNLSAQQGAAINALRARYNGSWLTLLSAAAGEGAIRADLDLRLVRLGLLGTLNWAAQWYQREGRIPAREIGATFAMLFLDGAGLPAAAAAAATALPPTYQ